MSNSLHGNDKFVTVQNKCSKSHRQPQCTLQFKFEDRLLFASVDLHVPLCGNHH